MRISWLANIVRMKGYLMHLLYQAKYIHWWQQEYLQDLS
jgi:hypothetical protein